MKICLCGSARFERAFHEWNERLTLDFGHVVYSLAVFPSQKNGEKMWYSDDDKEVLDLVHLAKIEESDAVLVVDTLSLGADAPYVGDSTRREIRWARMRGKIVRRASESLPGEDPFA